MAIATGTPCDEGVMRASAAHVPCEEKARPWILATTILASSMVFIDGTVVNVALPALQKEFDADASDAQWVIEAYALFLAALLLAGGSAGDRFGRKRVFAAGIALFMLASLACGLVQDAAQLILARAVQGIGGALLVPGSLAIISASFPENLRGKAIGTWSGYSAITAALGPVIGGFLIAHFSWRYAFFLNLPLGIAVLALTLRFVPESRDPQRHGAFDWAGALLISVSLGSLVFGLIESPARGWSDRRVVGALLLSLVAALAFVAIEMRHPAPLLPMRLFRSRNFSGANLLTLLLYGALGGGLYFLPLNLIQVQGYSATEAGAALLPFILIMFALSRWSGGLVDRYGPKMPLVIGPAIAALGFALFAVPGTGAAYWSGFLPAVTVLGLGMAVSVAPLTTTVMNALGTREAGTASGVNNAVSRVASVLAIAVLGLAMSHFFNRALDARAARLALAPELKQAVLAQRAKMGAIAPPTGTSPQEAAAVKGMVDGAFVEGFRRVMLLSCVLALASSLSAWLMIEGAPSPSPGRKSGTAKDGS